jgi:hypothetical protein
MVRIYKRAPQYLCDMRKRAAKEFSENFITRDEFDAIDKGLANLEQLIADIKNKTKKVKNG